MRFNLTLKISQLFLFSILFLSCGTDDAQLIDDGGVVIDDNDDNNDDNTTNIHPNIVLFIADDMSLDATPNYASELNATKPVMPTLESLMNTGLVFDNLWSYALCSPTRASILTGKHGIHTNVLAPIRGEMSSSHKSLQKYINEETNNAYAHAVFGKWHLGASETHPTQTMGIGTYSGNLDGGVPDYYEYDLVENEQSTMLSSTTDTEKKANYSTTKYTQLAIDWKEQQTKPWFVWLAYNAAHTPFHRPEDDLISASSIGRNETDTNNYLAMLEAMDYEMGRFIASLTDAEKANTIIIFIGDNGTPKKVAQFVDKDKHRKGSIYQGGINVPMVVSGLNTRVGRESTALIHTVDLFSTIAEIAGVDSNEIYNSNSFKELLTNADADTSEFVYTEVPGNTDNGSYTIRNNKYKLIYEIDTDRKELYDLITDKYEETDLMNNSSLTNEEATQLQKLETEGTRLRGEDF
jgi:arylsulfatase A-like enzyme